MMEKDIFTWIENALSGQLSQEEGQLFRKKLEEDADFAREVRNHEDAHDLVEWYSKIKVKEKVSALHQKVKARPVNSHRIVYLSAAAIFLLLAVATIVYNYSLTNYSNQGLISQHFVPYEDIFTHQGTRDLESKFLEGFEHYNKDNFDQAILSFITVPNTSKYYIHAQFYLGVAYLGNNQPTKAAGLFQYIITSSGLFDEPAEWYLALCYLSNNNIVEAEKILQKIVGNEESTYKRKDGELLLKELNSFWRKLPGVE